MRYLRNLIHRRFIHRLNEVCPKERTLNKYAIETWELEDILRREACR